MGKGKDKGKEGVGGRERIGEGPRFEEKWGKEREGE